MPKGKKMKPSNSVLRYAFAAFAIVLVTGLWANASVVQITGAAPGEGLTLNPTSVVYAIYAGYVGGEFNNIPYTV